MNASDTLAHLNWLAVLLATLAGFATGGLWYGPLFGKAWMKAHRKDVGVRPSLKITDNA